VRGCWEEKKELKVVIHRREKKEKNYSPKKLKRGEGWKMRERGRPPKVVKTGGTRQKNKRGYSAQTPFISKEIVRNGSLAKGGKHCKKRGKGEKKGRGSVRRDWAN